jgi:RHS repeat-associated protein
MTTDLKQNMKHICGSSRLGVMNLALPLLGSQNETYSQEIWTHTIGQKTFELSNHLATLLPSAVGNVLAVISDKPILNVVTNGGTVSSYMADIRSSQEERATLVKTKNWFGKPRFFGSPFGVTLDGRNMTLAGAEDYRYGFQGQEIDNEVKGKNNSVNYKYRMHDPRVGRFFARDPLAKNYPFISPYSFSGNKVTAWVELEGLEPAWILSWYSLTSADIDIITSGMTTGNALLIKSVAGKVKEMHDNYISGINQATEFTPDEIKILTGGDREMANMGTDGYRPVSAFRSAKDSEGKPVTGSTIEMYPIKTIDVATVHGKTYFKGQLKGSINR